MRFCLFKSSIAKIVNISHDIVTYKNGFHELLHSQKPPQNLTFPHLIQIIRTDIIEAVIVGKRIHRHFMYSLDIL